MSRYAPVRPPRRRGPSPLVVAGIAILPALALFGIWRFASGRGGDEPSAEAPVSSEIVVTPPPAAAGLATPLLSYRRVAPLLAPTPDVSGLTASVDSFSNMLSSTMCVAVSVDGVDAGSRNADVPLIPASNQKLVTGAAVLHRLGADYRFTTTASAVGASGGVVPGDLYLIGGGDPLLSSPDYDDMMFTGHYVATPTDLGVLADSIVAAGITRIDGSVVGDASRYDAEYYAPWWDSEVKVKEAGPIAALMANDSRSGGPDEWSVSENPAQGAASELTRLLRARGVTVAGDPTSGSAAADATVVATIASAPLSDVVAQMMLTSDNNTAELLLKELGFVAAGSGTTAAGAAAVPGELAAMGIDTTGVVVVDGSGLSNDNRTTCRVLLEILQHHTPGDALAAGLPVADGERGSLADIFTDTPVAGKLVAKTGTLTNIPFGQDPPAVKSLAGYLPLDTGGTIEFALVLNDQGTLTDQGVYRPYWDALVNVLAGYSPTGPSAAQLGPVS